MRKFLIFLVVVIVLGVGAYFLFFSKAPVAVEEPKEEPALQIQVWDSAKENVQPQVFSYGTVTAVHEVQLSFDASGDVQYVLAKPGDHVRKGQTLAILKNEAMAAQVNQAAASYESTQKQVESSLEPATEENLETARSQLKVANAQLENLQESELATDLDILIQREVVRQSDLRLKSLELGMSGNQRAAQNALLNQAAAGLQYTLALYDGVVLKAPFSGELLDWTLQEGTSINPGMPVGTLTDSSHVEIITYLSDEDARRIAVDSHVTVEGGHEAQVLGISSRISEETGKRKVRIALSSSDYTLNQSVELEIAEREHPLEPLIPLSAIEVDADDTYVYAIENGMLVRQKIHVLELHGEWARVDGEVPTLMALRAQGLNSGTHVEILP